jgi:hopanoid C-3 methylase HpnR
VTVLDGRTGHRLGRVPTGEYPAGLGHHQGLRRLYCGDTAAGTVTVIDTDTLRRVGTVPAELGAGSVAVDAERGRAYCANMLAASVTMFDPVTLRLLGRIAVGEGPCKAVVNPAAGHLYVASSLHGRLTRISLDTGQVLDELAVQRAPVGLTVSPDGQWLLYSEIFLRLEPLGLERVASALQAGGHEVRLIDLQVYQRRELEREVAAFRPEAVGFGLNYLANVPEVVDLAKWVKTVLPGCLVFAGGHSVSFVAGQVLAHGEDAIDVVLRGEGETGAPALLAAWPDRALNEVPGAVTTGGPGPPPRMAASLDEHLPARQLGGRRRKYFIGVMDPAASIEFTRGCPWDCSFCSAWTFYGRSYRRLSPEAAVEDMARITEPGVFIVDDVAFIKAQEGEEIARGLERRGIRKQYYLETRSDVLIRNEEVFRHWRRLGLNYMFLGLEALDEEGLKAFRKRSTPKVNSQALEIARSMGLSVAINIIADPDWDEARFAYVRDWAMSVPEIVNITVQTPYPRPG